MRARQIAFKGDHEMLVASREAIIAEFHKNANATGAKGKLPPHLPVARTRCLAGLQDDIASLPLGPPVLFFCLISGWFSCAPAAKLVWP